MVPRLWPDSTVVCLGSGPSLVKADVEVCRGRAHVIAVNDTYRLAPWADALYSSDAAWWHYYRGVHEFAGPKWSIEHPSWQNFRAKYPDVVRLRCTGSAGLESDPSGLRDGRNSGYAAINLALHYGARRVVLLGYDMQAPRSGPSHFFGSHPGTLNNRSPFALFLRMFDTLPPALEAVGVEVLNATRATALETFPRVSLSEALEAVAA